MVGTAGSGPKDRIDAGDEASMKILCPTSGIELQTNLREDTISVFIYFNEDQTMT